VYSFNPIPAGLAPGAESHILGVEACQWTVFFASMQQLEEMSFPRLCALAEVAWSPSGSPGFDDFSRRLKVQQTRFDRAGIAYWNDHAVKIGSWQPAQISSPTNSLEWDVPPQMVRPGKFRLSLNYSQGKNGLKISQGELLENGIEVARDAHEGWAGAGYNEPEKTRLKARDWNYFFALSNVKLGAKYAVRVMVSGNGGNDSSGVVFLDPPSTP
jgi:hexosaminidase